MRGLRSIAAFALVLVLVGALVAGCRTPSPAPSTKPSPMPSEAPFDPRPLTERVRDPETVRRIEAAALRLLPIEAWAEQAVLRQRVQIEWSGRSESFEAVLQRRPGELALIGLGPMNLVGFRIALIAAGGSADAGVDADATASGDERVVFENRSGRELPFSPTHMLADVQRVFYPWLGDAATCRDCERTGERSGLVVSERYGAPNLEGRRFGIAGIGEAGQVRIRYADWRGEPAIPFRVVVENGWFGYRLTIETLESLEADAPSPTPSRR